MDRTSLSLKPGLYIVSTPIGNLDDLTIRAIDTLKKVDLILCEDTRHSRTLLAHYGINKPLWSYNDHSTDKNRADIVQKIKEGSSLALISDAGTPLISDPGYKLVLLLHQNDIFVTSCPGPCSIITALTLSGCPTNSFSFIGFLPTTQKDRQSLLKQMKTIPGSLVLFSTANKLYKDLEEIKLVFGDVEIAIARELTKMFEQIKRNTISTFLQYLENETIKGEIVIVIPPQQEEMVTDKSLNEMVTTLKNYNVSSKDIVTILSKINPELSKQKIYQATVKQ